MWMLLIYSALTVLAHLDAETRNDKLKGCDIIIFTAMLWHVDTSRRPAEAVSEILFGGG